MSDSRRVEGERVFCHQCNNEWDRSAGGLTCPRCEGEFTEILQPNSTSQNEAATPPPIPRHPSERNPNPLSPLNDHNPWADVPDPDEGDISSYEFTMPGGRGTFSYTSYSTTRNGPVPGMPAMPGMFFMGGGRTTGGFGSFDTFGTGRGFNDFPRAGQAPGPQPRDMQDLFSMVFQTMNGGAFQQTRRAGDRAQPPGGLPPNPFDLLSAILNPGNGRHGDTVWSQEAFDRILEQLAEQNQMSTAPGPASENAIKNLPTKKVDQEMLGSDGKAECSICMDNVEVGTDVTTLPCNHWFHRECVVAWLKEHDTCPHCRKAITDPEERTQPQSSRRRSSRRSSSVASPYATGVQTGVPPGAFQTPDSPSALREQRQFYYGSRRDTDERPDRPRRHSSNHGRSRGGGSGNNRDSGGSGSGSSGGVTGWVRNRLGL
jgi:E3 ubiquitin-protein ligase RNF115/126